VVATWAVAFSWWLAGGDRWRSRAAVALLLLVFAPLILGAGPAGTALVRGSAGHLDQRRAANAVGADTAFVDPKPVSPQSTNPQSTASPPSSLEALPRGLRGMLLDPLPGQTDGNRKLEFALAENLVWWPALLLALIGILRGWRRRVVLAFPALVGGGLLLVYALVEGNFGTAYRHRGEFVWVVALLAATGAASLRRRPVEAPRLPTVEAAEPRDGFDQSVVQRGRRDSTEQSPETSL